MHFIAHNAGAEASRLAPPRTFSRRPTRTVAPPRGIAWRTPAESSRPVILFDEAAHGL